jgi:hypothetical protein
VEAVEAVGVADLDGEGDRECCGETCIIEDERGEADSGGCSWDGRGGKESGLSDIERPRCHETLGFGLAFEGLARCSHPWDRLGLGVHLNHREMGLTWKPNLEEVLEDCIMFSLAVYA